MKIVIRKGKVVSFTDHGNIAEQLSNLESLVVATQKHAANMQKVVARTLGVDPAIIEANDELRRQLRCANTTITLADRQLERNAHKSAPRQQ